MHICNLRKEKSGQVTFLRKMAERRNKQEMFQKLFCGAQKNFWQKRYIDSQFYPVYNLKKQEKVTFFPSICKNK